MITFGAMIHRLLKSFILNFAKNRLVSISWISSTIHAMLLNRTRVAFGKYLFQ